MRPLKPKNYDMDVLSKKRLLSKDEAAFYISVGMTTFTRIINSGDFYPLIRIGHNRGKVFINREKLDQWIDEQDGSMKTME